jgi:mannose-6-phosphate isomerase-like protein (cupin superfamily)
VVFHISENDAPTRQLRGGRGVSRQLINPQIGSQRIDLHVNVITANGPGPFHYHSAVENVYFVLEGSARLTTEEEVIVAGPGDAIFIPPGVPHDFAKHGDEDLRVVEIKAPPDADFVEVPYPTHHRLNTR